MLRSREVFLPVRSEAYENIHGIAPRVNKESARTRFDFRNDLLDHHSPRRAVRIGAADAIEPPVQIGMCDLVDALDSDSVHAEH